MASREHSSAAVDLTKPDTDTETDEQILADLAAAEAAAEAARERAQAARARAQTLRLEATSRAAETAVTDDADADDADADDSAADDPSEVSPRRRLRGLASWKSVVVLVAILIVGASIALTTVMLRTDRTEVVDRQGAADYLAAAASGATTLMSISHDSARDDVQHILDISTGDLHAQYQDTADDLIKQLTESNVVTKVSVTETAIESMDANSAVVLVAARTQRTTPETTGSLAEQQPTLWRLALTMVHEGDQIKVSKLEFL